MAAPGLNPWALDNSWLSDAWYHYILEYRAHAEGIRSQYGLHAKLPYLTVVRSASGEVLRSALESLMCFHKRWDDQRSGLLIVEDGSGGVDDARGAFPIPVYADVAYNNPQFKSEGPVAVGREGERVVARGWCRVVRTVRSHQSEFTIVRVQRVEKRIKPAMLAVTKVWQQASSESDLRPLTWFETDSPHGFRQGTSLITVHGVDTRLDGIHSVDAVANQGCCFLVRGLPVVKMSGYSEQRGTPAWERVRTGHQDEATVCEEHVIDTSASLFHARLQVGHSGLRPPGTQPLWAPVAEPHSAEGQHNGSINGEDVSSQQKYGQGTLLEHQPDSASANAMGRGEDGTQAQRQGGGCADEQGSTDKEDHVCGSMALVQRQLGAARDACPQHGCPTAGSVPEGSGLGGNLTLPGIAIPSSARRAAYGVMVAAESMPSTTDAGNADAGESACAAQRTSEAVLASASGTSFEFGTHQGLECRGLELHGGQGNTCIGAVGALMPGGTGALPECFQNNPIRQGPDGLQVSEATGKENVLHGQLGELQHYAGQQLGQVQQLAEGTSLSSEHDARNAAPSGQVTLQACMNMQPEEALLRAPPAMQNVVPNETAASQQFMDTQLGGMATQSPAHRICELSVQQNGVQQSGAVPLEQVQQHREGLLLETDAKCVPLGQEVALQPSTPVQPELERMMPSALPASRMLHDQQSTVQQLCAIQSTTQQDKTVHSGKAEHQQVELVPSSVPATNVGLPGQQAALHQYTLTNFEPVQQRLDAFGTAASTQLVDAGVSPGGDGCQSSQACGDNEGLLQGSDRASQGYRSAFQQSFQASTQGCNSLTLYRGEARVEAAGPNTAAATSASDREAQIAELSKDLRYWGCQKPTCAEADITLAADRFQFFVDREVSQCFESAKLMFSQDNDATGLDVASQTSTALKHSVRNALLQRGDWLYLVMPLMRDQIYRIVETLPTDKRFFGSIKLLLFQGIDNVSRRLRVSLRTRQIEQCPKRAFVDEDVDEAIDGAMNVQVGVLPAMCDEVPPLFADLSLSRDATLSSRHLQAADLFPAPIGKLGIDQLPVISAEAKEQDVLSPMDAQRGFTSRSPSMVVGAPCGDQAVVLGQQTPARVVSPVSGLVQSEPRTCAGNAEIEGMQQQHAPTLADACLVSDTVNHAAQEEGMAHVAPPAPVAGENASVPSSMMATAWQEAPQQVLPSFVGMSSAAVSEFVVKQLTGERLQALLAKAIEHCGVHAFQNLYHGFLQREAITKSAAYGSTAMGAMPLGTSERLALPTPLPKCADDGVPVGAMGSESSPSPIQMSSAPLGTTQMIPGHNLDDLGTIQMTCNQPAMEQNLTGQTEVSRPSPLADSSYLSAIHVAIHNAAVESAQGALDKVPAGLAVEGETSAVNQQTAAGPEAGPADGLNALGFAASSQCPPKDKGALETSAETSFLSAQTAQQAKMSAADIEAALKAAYPALQGQLGDGPAVSDPLQLPASDVDQKADLSALKKISSKGLNKLAKAIENCKPSGPMRGYQIDCVGQIRSGGNFVIVAPTGSGKTMIFVEAARFLLEYNKAAKVVVICPTVPLATQQAAVFINEGFNKWGYMVNAFHSDNQLTPETWKIRLGQYSVLVVTPQTILNILEDQNNPGSLNELDMLILDECHHCYGDHPYNKIMEHYAKIPEGERSTQVLGLTASPARSGTLDKSTEEMDELKNTLHASVIFIEEDNEEVQKIIPMAEEETIETDARLEDVQFAATIGSYISKCCNKVMRRLPGMVPGVTEMNQQCIIDADMGIFSNFLENWCKKTGVHIRDNVKDDVMPAEQREDWVACCDLLRCCNNSLELVRDAGFEACLRLIGKRTTELGKLVHSSAARLDSYYKKLLAGLYASKPLQDERFIEMAFMMGHGVTTFPRFVALTGFLLRYRNAPKFHGIVFTKTREGVYHLAEMMRNTVLLHYLTPIEFMGHGRTKARAGGALLDTLGNAQRGMSGNKQNDVLKRFKMDGRHVLVSTRAAEEGINVVNCQFVVKYSATETGIERVQSRGRARMRDAKFVNIVERDSKDSMLMNKSRSEEDTMHTMMKLYPDAKRI